MRAPRPALVGLALVVALVAQVGAASYVDTFNRANSATLGTSSDAAFTWTEVPGSEGLAIVGNQVQLSGVEAVAGLANIGTPLATANHYAQAVIGLTWASYANAGVMVRRSSATSDNTGFTAFVELTAATTANLLIWDLATSATVGTPYAFTYAGPHTVRLEANGTTLTASLDGVSRIVTTSASHATNIYTGFGAYSGSTADVETLDSFATADLGGGPPPTLTPCRLLLLKVGGCAS